MKADLKSVRNLENPGIDKCPYCGCDTYYYRQRFSGTGSMYERYDGEQTENTDMHEGLEYTPIGDFAYCAACERSVFRINKQRRQQDSMSNITTDLIVKIELEENEKEVLCKAHEILKDIAGDMWHEDLEDTEDYYKVLAAEDGLSVLLGYLNIEHKEDET